MAYPEFSPLPGSRRPQELFAPHSGAGGTGLPPADQLPTSEGFDELPFYIALNMHQLKEAPVAGSVLDVGTGTGSVIQWLFDLQKIRRPFKITGIDINEVDLTKAASRLGGLVDRARGDSLKFIRGSADELGRLVADGSFELITVLNSMHLYQDLAGFFQQAWRKLPPEGILVANTAYANDVMFPDPVADRRAWGGLVIHGKIALKRQGLETTESPVDAGKYSSDQIVNMAEKAGFRVFKTEVLNVEIPRDQAKALVAVEEFARGAIPGLPLDKVRTALVDAADTVLNRSGASGLNRGWFLMHAMRP